MPLFLHFFDQKKVQSRLAAIFFDKRKHEQQRRIQAHSEAPSRWRSTLESILQQQPSCGKPGNIWEALKEPELWPQRISEASTTDPCTGGPGTSVWNQLKPEKGNFWSKFSGAVWVGLKVERSLLCCFISVGWQAQTWKRASASSMELTTCSCSRLLSRFSRRISLTLLLWCWLCLVEMMKKNLAEGSWREKWVMSVSTAVDCQTALLPLNPKQKPRKALQRGLGRPNSPWKRGRQQLTKPSSTFFFEEEARASKHQKQCQWKRKMPSGKS